MKKKKSAIFIGIIGVFIAVCGGAAVYSWFQWSSFNKLINSPEFIDTAANSVQEAYDQMNLQEFYYKIMMDAALAMLALVLILVVFIIIGRAIRRGKMQKEPETT